MMTEPMGKVLFFPVAKRMSSRVAEERLGGILSYGYPIGKRVIKDQAKWLTRWMRSKSVLLGWSPVKEGVVKAFKSGRVRHLVSGVTLGKDGRPRVELCCSIEEYPVFNWEGGGSVRSVPVLVLGKDQEEYFRVCEKCGASCREQD